MSTATAVRRVIELPDPKDEEERLPETFPKELADALGMDAYSWDAADQAIWEDVENYPTVAERMWLIRWKQIGESWLIAKGAAESNSEQVIAVRTWEDRAPNEFDKRQARFRLYQSATREAMDAVLASLTSS